MDFLKEYKRAILDFIKDFLHQKKQNFPFINPWQEDFLNKLYHYAQGGKMIRGGLACFSYSLFQEEIKPCIIQGGAALELIQAALLIHDDIMDQDNLRRGEPSFHAQYALKASQLSFNQPQRFGESMGICAGDIGFFLAFDILSNLLEVSPTLNLNILQKISYELSLVGFAQMGDVYFEAFKGEPSLEEIKRLYQYKTARYSFSLPFMLGGLLTQIPQSVLSSLILLGEKMGVLFQITDDELDIFQTTKEIGKNAGSDITKNKKTLLRYWLYQKCNQEEKEYLNKVFGSSSLEEKNLAKVQDMLQKKGILSQLEKEKTHLLNQSKKIIAQLPLNNLKKEGFLDFLQKLAFRKK